MTDLIPPGLLPERTRVLLNSILAGLSGGGLPAIGDKTLLGNVSGASASPVAVPFASVTGVGSAAKWATGRKLTLGGDLTGNVTFDGSGNFTLTATLPGKAVVGTAVVDFGSTGSDRAVVAVSDAGVSAGSVVVVSVAATDSADHSADEHTIEDIRVTAGAIVAGAGFSIYAQAGVGKLYGRWNVNWVRN